MRNKSFPQATKSIAKAKLDLKEWGYCLLKDAIPTDLNDKLSKLIEVCNTTLLLSNIFGSITIPNVVLALAGINFLAKSNIELS